MSRNHVLELTRRGAFGRAGASLLGLVMLPAGIEAGTKKDTCKRRCKARPVVTPTCDEHCFPEFPLCYERTVGAPLCANGAFTNGIAPCMTDQDCLGDPNKPYCLVAETSRDAGSTSRFTTCEPYAEGCCISVLT